MIGCVTQTADGRPRSGQPELIEKAARDDSLTPLHEQARAAMQEESARAGDHRPPNRAFSNRDEGDDREDDWEDTEEPDEDERGDPFVATADLGKRNFDPNVGRHGVDRDKLSESDFAGRNRSYPVVSPEDVEDALQSIGRAGPGNYDAATLRRNILRIARRKGFPVPASAKKPKKASKGLDYDSEVWAHLEDAGNAVDEAERNQVQDLLEECDDDREDEDEGQDDAAKAARLPGHAAPSPGDQAQERGALAAGLRGHHSVREVGGVRLEQVNLQAVRPHRLADLRTVGPDDASASSVHGNPGQARVQSLGNAAAAVSTPLPSSPSGSPKRQDFHSASDGAGRRWGIAPVRRGGRAYRTPPGSGQ